MKRSPARSIATSTPVPRPIIGGMDSCPVNSETIPVPASATKNGIDVIANAFAIASFQSLPPLFPDERKGY